MNITRRTRAATALALAVVAAVTVLVAGTAGSAAGASPVANTDPGVLNGVYRISWTENELIAAGASHLYAHNNLGSAHGQRLVITATLRDGHMDQHWSIPPGCLGSYTVSGDRVTIREQVHCHG